MEFGKKGPKKEGDEDAKMAKMKALKELRDAMSKSDGEGLDKVMKMKKVTVAAPDSKDLKMGLDKAKDLVDKMPTDDGGEEEPDKDLDKGNDYQHEDEEDHEMSPEEEEEHEDHEEDESPEEEEDEVMQDMDSHEKIDELMKKLQEKKASLKR